MATIATTEQRARRRTEVRSRFYLWQTLACAAIAIGGFMPTYWLQLYPGTFIGPPLLHIHGALATAWILFLVSQAWLVSAGRLRNHRDWGLLGISLATAVVVVGVTVTIYSLKVELARGLGDTALAFFAVPLNSLMRFVLFTGAAIALTRRPEWHKRLMIVGTVGLIEAAAARITFSLAVGVGPGLRPGLVGLPPDAPVIVTGLLLQLIIIAGMVHDKHTLGRVHPAWMIGLAFDVAVIFLRIPVAHSGAWLAFADWTTRIAA